MENEENVGLGLIRVLRSANTDERNHKLQCDIQRQR